MYGVLILYTIIRVRALLVPLVDEHPDDVFQYANEGQCRYTNPGDDCAEEYELKHLDSPLIQIRPAVVGGARWLFLDFHQEDISVRC